MFCRTGAVYLAHAPPCPASSAWPCRKLPGEMFRTIVLRRNIDYLAKQEHYTSEIAENATSQYNASLYKYFFQQHTETII